MPQIRDRRGKVLHWDDVFAKFSGAAQALPIKAIDQDLEAMGYRPDKMRAAISRLGGRRPSVRSADEGLDAPMSVPVQAVEEPLPVAPKVRQGARNLAGILASQVARGWHLKSAIAGALGVLAVGLLVLPISQTVVARWSPASIEKVDAAAMSLIAQRKFAEAEPLYRLALSIEEKTSGPEHPKVALRLNNLAHLLQTTNRPDEAERLMLRALEIDASHFASDPTGFARDLNNMAQLLEATHRVDEAEQPYRHALAIFEQFLGAEHPNVATVLNNLAHLLHTTNRLDEAETLMARALEIDARHFGHYHINVVMDMNNLRLVRDAMGACGDKRALSVANVTWLGAEHPDVFVGAFRSPGQLLRASNWSATTQSSKSCKL